MSELASINVLIIIIICLIALRDEIREFFADYFTNFIALAIAF